MNRECLEEGMLCYMPELWPDYQNYMKTRTLEEPTVHEIFGAVVGPFMKARLWQTEQSDVIGRLFDFFEDMAASPDRTMQDVLCYGLLESLSEEDWLAAHAHMGEATRRLGKQVEEFWRQMT